MNGSDFRGKYIVRIRTDGSIWLPTKDFDWKPGDMLELEGYGFKDKIFIIHIAKSFEVNREKAILEA